jgi:hypothetical protein
MTWSLDPGMGGYPRKDSVEVLMSVSAWGWHGESMTTTGGAGRGPGGTWAGETVVTTCVIVAVLPLVLLDTGAVGPVDPLRTVISDHVFQPGGYALLGVSALALAAASVVLASGLRQAGLPRSRGPATLLGTVALALVLVAAFPTHAPGTSAGLVSNLHRAAGGWVIAMLPLAVWWAARRARTTGPWRPAAPTLGWTSGVTGVLSAFFLLVHVPIVIAGSPGFPLIGGVQRVIWVAVMVMLVVTARATRLSAARAAGPVAVPAAGPDLSDASLRGAA